MPGKQRVVEVADQEFSPSVVSLLEHEAFLNHVGRKLTEELNQIQSGEINWAIMHYEKGRFEAHLQYEALRSRIEKFMQAASKADLSAVVDCEDKFPHAQVVMNPLASGPSKTSYEFIEGIVR